MEGINMKKNIPFTRFMDMSSGGGHKEDWGYIYIQAPEDEACIIFYNRFGHNPHRVTCTCCGDDYSISESINLEQATGYDRGCEYENGGYVEKQATKYSYRKYIPLKEYLKSKDILVIYDKDIKNDERFGELPEQGYVWVD
jgi:hypothetical protein